jgi:hypothetical protein
MKLSFWSRHKCPGCKADLKAAPPQPTKVPWYKLVSRQTLSCPYCQAKLEKRFWDFDLGMASVFSCSGAVSIWGAGKIVLTIVLVTLALRFTVGRFLSVYMLARK